MGIIIFNWTFSTEWSFVASAAGKTVGFYVVKLQPDKSQWKTVKQCQHPSFVSDSHFMTSP